MLKRPGSALLALAVLAGAIPASTAAAAGAPGTISISPSRTVGKAVAKRSYGPITLTNSTDRTLQVKVVPTLLRQDLTGAIFVNPTKAAQARATELLTPQIKSFTLAPGGAARSVQALLEQVPAQDSFYGGLLFQSKPAGKVKAKQIEQVFRINGSLYLDPVPRLARVRFGGQPMRAEQAKPRVLSLITPIVNKGNWALKVRGEIRVIDSNGQVRFRHRAKTIDVVLPNGVVELRQSMAEPVLPPGVYQLRGRWRTEHGERFTTSGEMRLFGPNAVATKGAKLVDVTTGPAYYGEPVKVKTKFHNTGNVVFAPSALVTVRPLGPGGSKPFARKRTAAARAGADKDGSVELEIGTPPGKRAFEVSVRLFDGKRLLDSRSLSLLPQQKPSVWKRITTWITDHALLIIALLIGLLIAVLLLALATRRRRRGDDDEALRPGYVAGAPPQPAPAPEPLVAPPAVHPPPAPVTATGGAVDINSASVDELMTLPGLGRRAAERLIAHREAHGPFAALADLSAVEGFHQERINRIAERAKI